MILEHLGLPLEAGLLELEGGEVVVIETGLG